VLAVFAVALALRLLHLVGLEASWQDTHLFGMARGDEAHHWYEALEILDEDPLLRNRVFWKGPGYSYFLAGLIALFGSSPGALRWPLAVLGATNCAALVVLARRALPLSWSVVAGLLAAANGVLILFDGELLFPTLLISLNLPALWLLSGPRAGIPAHAGAGALLGLAALVHPVYVRRSACRTWSCAVNRCLSRGTGASTSTSATTRLSTSTRGTARTPGHGSCRHRSTPASSRRTNGIVSTTAWR
jgi:hypothetical protein